MGSVGSVTSCVSWDDRLKGIERRGGALQDFRGEGAWPEHFLIGRCFQADRLRAKESEIQIFKCGLSKPTRCVNFGKLPGSLPQFLGVQNGLIADVALSGR